MAYCRRYWIRVFARGRERKHGEAMIVRDKKTKPPVAVAAMTRTPRTAVIVTVCF